MYLSLLQKITVKKGATMKNGGSHIIMKKGGLHCLSKQCVNHFLLSLSLAILWLVVRVITTDIINQNLHLSLDTFLLL
jgi:hypothetical protein